MAGSFTRIAPEALTRFTQGDEDALERIFRDDYDELLARATSELDDPAAASRLVELAFFEAWKKHGQFASPGDLEAFLRQTIHRAALREQGRRAALHRFQEHEGAVAPHAQAATAAAATVDEAWADLHRTLRAPPPDNERSATARHDMSRHEAATHVAHIADDRTSLGSYLLIAGVAIVVLGAIVGAVRWYDGQNLDAHTAAAVASDDARLVSTRPAQRASTTLSDGSAVSLGPDTQLRIAKGYSSRLRGVGVAGTASFTVANLDGAPFTIVAGPARVVATGTVIDVSAYPSMPVIIRVREGSATVIAGTESHPLSAGEALTIADDGAVSTPTANVLDQSLGWTEGQFVLVDVPMRDLPALLQRWYGLQVMVPDTALLGRPVSIRVPLDSARLLVDAIEKAGNARYVFRGENRMFVSAGGT